MSQNVKNDNEKSSDPTNSNQGGGFNFLPLLGALLGGAGGANKGKGGNSTTATTTRSDPWEPSIDDLKYAQTESRRLYDERGNLLPPPERDFGDLRNMIPGRELLTGGIGAIPGGGRRGEKSSGGSSRPGGGGNSKPGYWINDPGFGGGVDALNERYEGFMDGGGLNFDTDVMRALRDQIEREFGGIADRRTDEIGDAFDLSGMTSSSLMSQEVGEIEDAYSDDVGDAYLGAALGLREQDIGLLSHFGSLEQAGISAAESAAASRYGSDKSAAAQLGSARISANASRANTRASIAEAARGRRTAEAQWAWNAEHGISNQEHDDDLRTWGFENSLDRDALDRLINRSTAIGGSGGSGSGVSKTTGGDTGNELLDILAGAGGGYLAFGGGG